MLPDTTHIGCVRLKVSNLERSLDFYAALLGLDAERENGDRVRLRPRGGESTIVELVQIEGAQRQPVRATGLFHMAILVPTREALGTTLRRLVSAGWPLQGASDHLVSEALYLADPDGIGIEIYADRPRDEWKRRNDQIEMATIALDVDGLLAVARPASEAWTGLPVGTTMGHVHLRGASLEQGEELFHRIIGLDVTTRRYSGALFMSAGGYHHHVAVNVWEGRGLPPLPEKAVGLLDFDIVIPDAGELDAIAARARDSGVEQERTNGALVLRGTDGIRVRLVDGSAREHRRS